VALALAACAQRVLAAQLPVPCLANSCGSSASGFVTSGKATATQTNNTLTVSQLSTTATLNWASFNLSADGKVIFNQPGATAVALNRIFQSSPSAIFGQITANGELYLVNANGFIFGPTASVNASGLIASSLGISDAVFGAGLLAPQWLESQTPVLGSADVSNSGTITVEQGATLSTPSGRLLLAAPLIQNSGTLSAPDGQVVLAAGQQVFLQASTDPTLRGLVVEVDGGGTASNLLDGLISTPRGNVTLVGLAVNQDGRISATTSVAANGSVRLEAANTTTFEGGGGLIPVSIASSVGGTLTLGPQSSIDITPELSSSATAVSDQTQMQSQITLLGEQILIHGANITAPGGGLQVIASADPGTGVVADGNSAARLRIDDGTTIDLQGSSVELPMSANLLAIRLGSNELADDPDQRNGILHGATVYVDANVGSTLINSQAFDSALEAVQESVGQRTEAGGSASFESEGDVVIQSGTTINVSGGSTTYLGGILQTTQLVGQNGQLYDISTANPSLTYTGIVNPTFTQSFNTWGVQQVVSTPGLSHYQPGYVQGASAGSISVAAPNIVLSGTLIGQATNGPLQRGSSAVPGGQLLIGLPGALSAEQNDDYLAPSLEFVSQAAPIVVSDGSPLLNQLLQLPVEYLTAGGFTSTKIYSNGTVSLPAGLPLNLNPGGSLLVQADRIDVSSSITAPGGSIELLNATTVDTAPGVRPGIQIGDGVTLDVSGEWTNDYATVEVGGVVTGQTLQNGGSIALDPTVPGSELSIGNNVSFAANGGAWLQSGGTLDPGHGGSISLGAAPPDSALQIGSGVSLQAFGVVGASGGSFSLTAPRILITTGSSWAAGQSVDDLAPNGGSAPAGEFTIGSGLFDTYGFSNFTLTANSGWASVATASDSLTVQAGTSITPLTESLQLQPGYALEPTGAPLSGFTRVITPPLPTRPPTSVSLSVAPSLLATTVTTATTLTSAGALDVQAGSSITSDPGSSIALSSPGGVYVDGILRAPGGTISLSLPGPSGFTDPGYLADLSIELGPQAVLDAAGAFVATPNTQNLSLGSVLGGGAVSLEAARGSVVTAPGSQINVDGTSAAVDEPTTLGGSYALFSVPSAAGSLIVQAPESISLLGSLAAHAGAGNYGEPAGGYLGVDLTRSEYFAPPNGSLLGTFPTTPRVIELVSQLPADAVPSNPDSGMALLGISQIEAAGIDSLRLEAGDEVLFASSLPLSLTRQLILDAPAIGVAPGINAAVNTNFAELGYSIEAASPATPTAGTGTLSISAQQIDLLGSFVLQNVASARLSSAGDIELLGVFDGATQFGQLSLDGNLTLAAERIYPATYTSFSLDTVHGSGDPASMVDSITLLQNGSSPGTPLSAGGSVSIAADVITSSGTLMAPFGSITLSANDSLSLLSGSVTSVSGAGLTIPYGSTEFGGEQWFYTPVLGTQTAITGIPQRAVSLTAPALKVSAGATIDLTGGGDLYAYEWVPGPGGTADALGQSATTGLAVTPGLYAVLPSTLGQYAPYDPQETPLAGISMGASIYIAGGGGLAPGVYPLLPARDALVPGAYLVQVQSGFNGIQPGQLDALADGTPVVAGYLTFGTTGLHSGSYVGVAVWPGTYAQDLAQYQITDASTFFAAAATEAGLPAPPLPADAGSLSVAVTNSLSFLGTVQGNAPGSGGLSSKIDISASDLEITATAAAPTDGAVGIEGSVLASWDAGQLVIGGHPSADGGTIDVTANTVTVDGGADVVASQVILVANQSIDLAPGATVLSTSAAPNGKAPATLPTPTALALTSSNPSGAALLAVSDLSLPIVQPTSDAAGGGTISIASGARMGSLGALSLDGPGGVSISGALSGAGASWSLASSSIGFVGSGSSADTLQINSGLLSQLQNAGAVLLSSNGAINLYTPVRLGAGSPTGTPTLSSLTLLGSALVNQGGADGSVFGAQSLTLGGALDGAQSPGTTTAKSGALSFVAGQLNLGPGDLSISGFQDTSMAASSAVVGQGTGGLSTAGSSLSLSAPQLTAVAGAQTTLSAPTGTVSISTPGGKSASTAIANDLGGELDIDASSMQVTGSLVVPAGIINLSASQDIALGSSAVIDAGGRVLNIAGQSVGAEGGNVTLNAGGNLTLAPGSAINVSGAGDAPAGNLVLVAAGAADLSAKLSGSASSGAQGGSFSLDAGSLTQGLTPLANALEAGGFTAADSIHVQSGDLSLASGAQLAANQIALVADTGAVDIAGSLTAGYTSLRGNIQLFGGTGVSLEPTAQVTANTVGGPGIGGEIELGTMSGGSVVLDAGSVLSATGTTADGTLLVRAPLLGSDVAFTNNGATLGGFAQIAVEPIITMPVGSTFGASDLATVETQADTTVASVAPAIQARLNPTGALPLVVQAAVDLTQSGSLTIDESLDLSGNTQSSGAPIDLTFRVGGSISVGTASTPVTISDGFTESGGTLQLMSGASSSFRFVAGANASSPDPLAITSGSSADLSLQPGSIIRTGTGEIDLVASGDIVFAAPGASGADSASVYTAGINPIGPAGTPIAGITVPGSSYVFNFPTQGGSILLNAGGDILGSPVQQSVQGWQLREGNGTSKRPTQWGVDLDEFGWNVGSLGGGDVSVSAGGAISELSAAAADSYYDPSTTTTPIYTSSGGLAVSAGGDIGSSQFYLADGSSLLRAGGAFSAIEPVGGTSTNVGSLLALGDAQISIEARTGIQFDVIMNPTANTEVLLDNGHKLSSSFYTYGADSSVSFQTTDGNVSLGSSATNAAALMGSSGAGTIGYLGQVYPSTLVARSLTQDVSLGGAYLYPSNDGQLEVIAGQDISGLTMMTMSDAADADVATPASPSSSFAGAIDGVSTPFSSGRHGNDPTAALIVAGQDIDNLSLSIPKATDIIAGRDINDLIFYGQNLNPTDLTLISAGRDINAGVSSTIEVGGPGAVDVIAGRNIDLGFSAGITTIGNTLNPNLVSTGADLTVAAGLNPGADYSGFVSKIIAPDPTNQALLVSYMEDLTGQSDLTYQTASGEFANLSADQQQPLVDEVFFDELSLSGLQANANPQAGFSLGNAAIDALFPNSRSTSATNPSPYQGDLSLTFSRIYTTNGGGISILVPGGELDVGLANPPASVAAKLASDLGIVAQGAGDVNIYTLGDVNVNSSRIFTLGGGNILIWSDEGSIDAGRGSKSSVSAPPPQVLVDASGNVTLSFSGAVAGSGIRTIQIDPTVPAGNVNLIAPEGTVNAGDAGIGAAGDINIAAQRVLGVNNINFGGTATGVPPAVSNLAVSLSGATTTASSATNSTTSAVAGTASSTEATTPLAQSALSWLDVFVTGLGEENCRADDVECLKRQKR